ncbi:MAG: aminotransferase class I/II-fold pyridoxal phosphate-dependent enzyme [Lachnospiraceae bacterium]|nr:aminotransferase class I/II-fold pyridoxal phosphate-dependent enzyme [Lachnospiraceae bacterium]
MSHGGDIYRNKIILDHSVNLNPMPLPDALLKAFETGERAGYVYPDIRQERIRSILSGAEGIPAECVYAGNGASELILACVRAIAPKKALLIEPCFTGYKHALLSLSNCEIEEYMLKEADGFALTEDVLSAIGADTDLLFLCDPWNPTGQNIAPGLLEAVLGRALETRTKVILDQSFLLLSEKGRTGPDAADFLKRFPDLILLRSYTKLFSLPGIRMGYVMGAAKWIGEVISQLPEWNLSAMAEAVMEEGTRLILETDFCLQSQKCIRDGRKQLSGALCELGFTVYRSDTDFILFRTEKEIFAPLKERGILIRDCKDLAGLDGTFYRIAVRNDADNRVLIENMKEIVQ